MMARIYDVYLNHRNELLVLPRGSSIPSIVDGGWQHRKRVRVVSEAIRAQIAHAGFYRRRSGKQHKAQRQPA
jgi:hypothetical protein